jgi:nucleoside-diphosphate-sugar epimerase
MATYKIIIAKYNEPMYYLQYMNHNNILIYNKGYALEIGDIKIINRKNIGREVESFLYYIVDNYENLPDYVIFLQGDPFPHLENITPYNFQQKIDELISSNVDDVMPLFKNKYYENHNVCPSLKTREYYELFFNGQVPDKTVFSNGCQYIVPKQNILNRPKQFYMKLHSMTLNTTILTEKEASQGNTIFDPNSIDGWTLERLLMFCFTKELNINPVMCQKRYLVTGGAGFIGSNIVNKLANDNSVIVVDNLCTGNINYINKNMHIQFIDANVLDTDKLYLVGYVDGIYHLAAMSKVLPSLDNKEMVNFCINQNVLGSVSILNYASSFTKPIKVIYSASSTSYGLNEIPNVETQQSDCQTPYALSKYCGELFCELYYKLYNVPNVRLKYFMVYGPNEPSEGSYAIVTGIFLKKYKEGNSLIIHGDGTQTRDFVHVDDVCHANIIAMNNDNLCNDTINIGTGEMISIKELADLISPNQIYSEARKIDLKHTLCDTTKCKEKLNWVPTKKIKDYLTSILKSDC